MKPVIPRLLPLLAIAAVSIAALPARAGIAADAVRTDVDGIDLVVIRTGVQDVVTVVGSLRAGDDRSPEDNTSIATLTGEMLDKGTTRRGKFAIAEQLGSVGARIGFAVGAERGRRRLAMLHLDRDRGQRGAGDGQQRDQLVVAAEAAGRLPEADVTQQPEAQPALQHALGQRLADQEPRPGAVGARTPQRVPHRRGHHLGRILEARERAVQSVRITLEYLLDQRGVDRVLGLEMVVERAEADVGRLGDLVDGDAVHATGGHQVERGPQQLAAGLATPP